MTRLILTLIITLAAVPVYAQLPTRLVQAGDITASGSFNVPAMQDVETHWSGTKLSCEYAQGVIGFNAARQSLYIVCHDWSQSVGEISLTGAVLQQPRQIVNLGAVNPTDPNSKKIGGLFVEGGRLLVSGYSFYDGNVSAVASHFSRSLTLSESASGPVRVGDNPGWTAGHMTAIPSEWQAALGGTMLTGQCCLSIISRTSLGPSAYVFTPANPLASSTAATRVLGYPLDNATLGGCSTANTLFNCASSVRGVVFVPGTRSVLYFGTLAKGTIEYKTVNGGYSGQSYQATVWAYDANDLLAVKNGTKQAHQVVPYATWQLPGLTGGQDMIGGAAYDPATRTLYVTKRDNVRPVVYRYTISAASVPPVEPPPPPPPVEPPPPPPPPADPCVVNQGVLVVTSWPSLVEGSRQLRYSYTVPNVVATVRSVLVNADVSVTVTDSRGCSVVTRK